MSDLRVLVVDDDFMVARIHERFVERTPGFEVVASARTGAEALALVEQVEVDLVLLDVHLPDISGLEVLRRLREAGYQPGVIMVTAEREADVVRAALLGGAQQYLVKPFDYPDLADRLVSVGRTLAVLAGDEPADQAAIDRAFGAGAAPAETLPKGLSAETARAVLTALADHEELSATEASEVVGVSRVSARRYLEHFVEAGRAEVRLRYGGTGRPERLYRAARR